ncbi:bifunctional diaminohydroxyphosphoribosylaminopyrimidine deaminase/5-amino-6-(5-phosphoribosylamino)uracil reductase RibD [Fulvimonas sp. R45]|uniref:bifunctional diaminohydroxyphosphoribosylaminopyrimidine deaminase/5-amino-6-(5-phosphoribosylamino)uracil reductase RibD n=1 Tax=Fulvimonas sp. R45 TaxID=3045937 RepID=UPI00265DE3D5|nr:bifunctional diaminohydroxyphosphoribosylaminopyrimidine deaminase/5-amino-6-(5-phosphoribosylamino)uracil reductase RibD [Fulvimonas sp. R45]MDO1528211.1 bifunctional diaminohydroxyphosphoribosylaminopyrimidine deaminase/5-amino-6-(5-phosphoribosylamino)uracil reductase RibD [Fulvimonas sp. R45]
MNFTAVDHLHMAHALRLAERGLFTTQPNPRVGCVLAHGDEVVGTGWHQRAGEPHAEVFALREAGERARGATAYVTLEPCAHHGRTPPCADALVAAGAARVVIAAEDPFPQVAGRGIEKLRAAGIAVETGLLRDEARELNIGFFSRLERGRPFVRVKLATSLDGRTALASGESKWITGAAARADVQRWRARSSAILTGIGTVLADDPRLTVRLDESLSTDGRDAGGARAPATHPGSLRQARGGALPGGEGEHFVAPLRVVLDRGLRTPVGSHVLDGSAPTLVLHGAQVAAAGERFAHVEHAAVAERDGMLDLPAVLAVLAERGCNELHVEAGPTLCGALFAQGLADELLLYVAPVLLGDAARPLLRLPALDDMAGRWRLRVVEQRAVGPDWRLRLRP